MPGPLTRATGPERLRIGEAEPFTSCLGGEGVPVLLRGLLVDLVRSEGVGLGLVAPDPRVRRGAGARDDLRRVWARMGLWRPGAGGALEPRMARLHD